MTGKDLITKEMLESHDANERMIDWFNENYPNGGEYQEILDKLCESEEYYTADYLLCIIGATTDVLELDELVDVQKDICYAGSIHAKGEIIVRNLRAGGCITAGLIDNIGNVRAGGYIYSRYTIAAGGHIVSSVGISSDGSIKSDEFIEANGFIRSDWYIRARSFVRAGLDILTGGEIDSGEYIESGSHIKAGGYIYAGRYIEAVEDIEAGEDYGIYAGNKIPISEQEKYGYITAKSKPKNIICGYWRGNK